jgi:hypothetical protein
VRKKQERAVSTHRSLFSDHRSRSLGAHGAAGATRSSGHVLDDQYRGLVGVVVAHAYDPQRSAQDPVTNLSELKQHFPDSRTVIFPHIGHDFSIGGASTR